MLFLLHYQKLSTVIVYSVFHAGNFTCQWKSLVGKGLELYIDFSQLGPCSYDIYLLFIFTVHSVNIIKPFYTIEEMILKF